MMLAQIVAGLDVAKDRVDVSFLADGTHTQASYTDVERLASDFAERGVTLAVLEPTGGYERKVGRALEAAGIPLSVVNARHIRHFARAAGMLAKTDRLDARALAEYGQRMTPTPRPSRSAERQILSALLRRRRQIVNMRKAELTRRQQADACVLDDIEDNIAGLTKRIKTVEKRIQEHIAKHKELDKLNLMLRSMPGIGAIAAATLMAELPELGQISRKKIAALVGLAPYARDSGSLRGKRTIWGGRAQLRETLHMSIIAAIRCQTNFKTAYNLMRERGKPHKVATTALLRKMIVQLNAMVRQNKLYQHSC